MSIQGLNTYLMDTFCYPANTRTAARNKVTGSKKTVRFQRQQNCARRQRKMCKLYNPTGPITLVMFTTPTKMRWVSPCRAPGKCGGQWNTGLTLRATPLFPAASCPTSKRSRPWPRGRYAHPPFRGKAFPSRRPTFLFLLLFW